MTFKLKVTNSISLFLIHFNWTPEFLVLYLCFFFFIILQHTLQLGEVLQGCSWLLAVNFIWEILMETLKLLLWVGVGPHSHKGPIETQNLWILSLKGEIKYKIYFYLPFGRADKFNSVLKEKGNIGLSSQIRVWDSLFWKLYLFLLQPG